MKKSAIITIVIIFSCTYCLSQPLFDAAQSCDTTKINSLIVAGADLLAKDAEERRVLYVAARSGCVAAVKLLVRKGVPVESPNSVGTTALMVAALMGKGSVVEALLTLGADPNRPNDEGTRALAFAAENGYLSIVKTLLAQNVDLNAKNKFGMTALSQAIALERWDVVDFLIDASLKNTPGSRRPGLRKGMENAIRTEARKTIKADNNSTCDVYLSNLFPPDKENPFYKVYAIVYITTGPAKYQLGYVDYYKCFVTRDGKWSAKAVLK